MSATSATQGRPPAPSGTRTEQVYFTHCLPGDSLRNEPGYSIRAASTADPALLDFAARFTAYELPLDMWGQSPSPAEAPRRLALVPAPGGLSALVHTSYLPEDTRGRKHSYFSHFLFRGGVTAEQALAAWASADWRLEYPQGADKQLRDLPGGLPRPGPLDDAALSAFLRGDNPAGEQPLARAWCPSRLPRDPRARQELMLLVLQGCVLALRAGEGAPRGRFYVLAEPGLAALFFYGAARLLPRGLVRLMTFSTYENMHSALKPYRLAQLVATWTPNPARGLDLDYHQSRGYALDTFNDKSSPELRVCVPPGLERFVALAAEGKWATVCRALDMLGPDATALDQLGTVLDVIDRSARLAERRADDDDLIALKGSPWGQEALRQHPAAVWPRVRAGAPGNERLRKEFRDLLWENKEELRAEVAGALAGAAVEPWRQRWDFYKKVLQDNGAPAAGEFLGLLPTTAANGPLPLAPAFRLPLLQEWLRLNDSAVLAPAVVPLLTSVRDADLGPLWRSELPAEWGNLAVLSTMLGPAPAPTAVGLLRSADEARLTSFLHTLRGRTKDREEMREKVLLPLATGATPELLSRLFRAGLTGTPAFLLNLLNAAGVFDAQWYGYWLQEPSLELLFLSMKEHAAETGPIWKWFIDQINDAVLVRGDPGQRKLLERLDAARAALGTQVPPDVDAVVRGWVMLRQHFDPSYRGPRFPSKDLRRGCERLGIDPIELLRADFEQFVLPQGAGAINRFEDTFHGFVPIEPTYQNANTRLEFWLKVVKVCKEQETRAGYQEYYLEKFIDEPYRLELATEAYNKQKLEKRVLQQIRQAAEAKARAEEEARAALVVTAAPRLEDRLDPDLARHLKRHRGGGRWKTIAFLSGVCAAVVVGCWVLIASMMGTPGTPRENGQPDKDKKVAVRDKERDKDKGGKKDGENVVPPAALPDFKKSCVQPMDLVLTALLKEVGTSLKLADERLIGTDKSTLQPEFGALQKQLHDRQVELNNLTTLYDTRTAEGWQQAAHDLEEIAEKVDKIAVKYHADQDNLYKALGKPKPPSDEEKAKLVRDWFKKAPPSVIAGLVETYAIEWCNLSAKEVQDNIHPVLVYYIKAAGREGTNANFNPDLIKKITNEILAFRGDDVLAKEPAVTPPKPASIKEATKKLRDLFGRLEPVFEKVVKETEKEALDNSLKALKKFLTDKSEKPVR
jgi:hypothetical protein